MAEPQEIFNITINKRNPKLKGKNVLITAGPTYEAIDPVRFIGNRSSGKMGIELAKVCANNGAKVNLILGPTHMNVKHPYISVSRIESADEMYSLCSENFESVDISLFAAAVFFFPNFMGHPDNYIEANPMVTPAHIVPEWYLLPFYAILRSVPDKLLGVIAMLSAILILAALPWLDTSKIRSAVFRPLYKQFYWILVLDVLVLGYVGAMPAEGLYLLIARIGTAYYFAHFLIILPILGKVEKLSLIHILTLPTKRIV